MSDSRPLPCRALYRVCRRGHARWLDLRARCDERGESLLVALGPQSEVSQQWWVFPHQLDHSQCPLRLVRWSIKALHLKLIRRGFTLSPVLYVLALEPFRRRLRANPVLRGDLGRARHTAYTDDVIVFVRSRAEVVEISKEIWRYEVVTEAKTCREKSVGLQFGSSNGPFLQLDRRAAQVSGRLVRSRSPAGDKLIGAVFVLST